jgi:hypothetical protein
VAFFVFFAASAWARVIAAHLGWAAVWVVENLFPGFAFRLLQS